MKNLNKQCLLQTRVLTRIGTDRFEGIVVGFVGAGAHEALLEFQSRLVTSLGPEVLAQ